MSAGPVVVVPGGMISTGVSRSVVVALDGETAATAALDFAFIEAELARNAAEPVQPLPVPGHAALDALLHDTVLRFNAPPAKEAPC